MLDDFEFDRDQTKAVCIYFGLLYEEFRLHKDGSIDKKSWTDWENNLNRHARTPGFLKAWDITNQFFDFDDEFASFINKKIPKVRGNSR